MKVFKIILYCMSLMLVASCVHKKGCKGCDNSMRNNRNEPSLVNPRPVPSLIIPPRLLKTKNISTDTLVDNQNTLNQQ